MPRLDNSQKAEIVLVSGSSGSRKTTYVKKIIEKRKRVAVYDAAKHEYGDVKGMVIAKTQRELLNLLKAHKTTALKVAFQPPRPCKESFNFWCNCMMAWGWATVVAEELADVTTAGKAPQGWGDICRKGRAIGLKVYGLTQRPAESDKTIIGNASMLHAGRQTRANDRKYMAAELNISPDELLLDDGEFIEFIPTKSGKPNAYKRGVTR
jgi:hypothetical protein